MTRNDHSASDSQQLQRGLQRFKEAIDQETKREKRKQLVRTTCLLLSSLIMAVYVTVSILPVDRSVSILSFNQTPLDQVLNELEEEYEIKVAAANTQLLECLVTGKFYTSDPEQFVSLVAYSLNLEVIRVGAHQYSFAGQGCSKQQ